MRLMLLSVRDLKVNYRIRSWLGSLLSRRPASAEVIAGVSLDVAEHESVGIVGESGSGKTTLARTIMGLVKSSSGTIAFQGRPIVGGSRGEDKRILSRLAMMFQDPVSSLSPRLTVRSLILEPFTIHHLPLDDRAGKARELLAEVGLSAEYADRYPHQLSGGEARRVSMARALALRPRLVLADEPTAGLDVSIQGEIVNLLSRLKEEQELSIIFITHNLSVVRHTTDRVVIMYLGRVVECGPTEEVFRQPRHPYTAALLSATPVPDPDARTNRIVISGEVPSFFQRPKGCEFHPRCLMAREKCRHVAPELGASAGTHTFTCHFPLGDTAEVRRPSASDPLDPDVRVSL
jgi:oligopeptide/dipeptide ABC transporter ATP-binding protein